MPTITCLPAVIPTPIVPIVAPIVVVPAAITAVPVVVLIVPVRPNNMVIPTVPIIPVGCSVLMKVPIEVVPA